MNADICPSVADPRDVKCRPQGFGISVFSYCREVFGQNGGRHQIEARFLDVPLFVNEDRRQCNPVADPEEGKPFVVSVRSGRAAILDHQNPCQGDAGFHKREKAFVELMLAVDQVAKWHSMFGGNAKKHRKAPRRGMLSA